MGRMEFTEYCSKIPGKILLVSPGSFLISKSHLLQIFQVLKAALVCIEPTAGLWARRNQSGLYAVLEIWGQINHMLWIKIYSTDGKWVKVKVSQLCSPKQISAWALHTIWGYNASWSSLVSVCLTTLYWIVVLQIYEFRSNLSHFLNTAQTMTSAIQETTDSDSYKCWLHFILKVNKHLFCFCFV